MKTQAFFFILFIISCQFCYSQITIGEIEKKVDTAVLKPAPYDSLKNIMRQPRNIDYKQYIGLQFYLPPFSNPKIGSSVSNKTVPFLFSTKPNLLFIDTTQIKLRARENWYQTSMNKSFSTSIGYDQIYTYAFSPFHYYSGNSNGEITIGISNNESVSNRYYTLLDILYEDDLNKLWQNMNSDLKNKASQISKILNQYKKDLYKNSESTLWQESSEKLIVDRQGFRASDGMSEIIFICI